MEMPVHAADVRMPVHAADVRMPVHAADMRRFRLGVLFPTREWFWGVGVGALPSLRVNDALRRLLQYPHVCMYVCII